MSEEYNSPFYIELESELSKIPEENNGQRRDCVRDFYRKKAQGIAEACRNSERFTQEDYDIIRNQRIG